MSLSDKMIYLRNKFKISTEELSARSNVPIGTLNKIFTGETKNPTGKTASKIAKVFDVTAEYLLNDDIPIEGYKEKSPETANAAPEDMSDKELLATALTNVGILKPGQDLTDEDTEVVMSAFRLLEAWFAQKGKE